MKAYRAIRPETLETKGKATRVPVKAWHAETSDGTLEGLGFRV